MVVEVEMSRLFIQGYSWCAPCWVTLDGVVEGGRFASHGEVRAASCRSRDAALEWPALCRASDLAASSASYIDNAITNLVVVMGIMVQAGSGNGNADAAMLTFDANVPRGRFLPANSGSRGLHFAQMGYTK